MRPTTPVISTPSGARPRVLFLSGREIGYIRNRVLVAALRQSFDVDVLTPDLRGGIVARSAAGLARYAWRRPAHDVCFAGFFGQPLALALASLRNVVRYHDDVRAGTWHYLSPGTMQRPGELALGIAGVRIDMEGEDNIPSGACLFMANHTSAVDPVAVFVAIPRRIAFLAKKEIFRMPLIGWAMRLAGFIPVDRSSREAAAASADVATEQLRAGASMVIYPEGTRSPDGKLLPFKRGGFLMAIRGGRPVVPMTISPVA
mgnify:CR=1 FL=1